MAIGLAFMGMAEKGVDGQKADIELVVVETDQGLVLNFNGTTTLSEDLGELIYHLDKRITLALQQLRKDLFFVHAGAVASSNGGVVVLAAASGAGKSTMTWALLHAGYGYLSDELAPIDPETLRVHAYPHALCLKNQPPPTYPLPEETLETSRTLLVPVRPAQEHGILIAILFVNQLHEPGRADLNPLHSARAATRLYANTLNPLAHPNDGLETSIDICKRVPAFELDTSDLQVAINAVAKVFENHQ